MSRIKSTKPFYHVIWTHYLKRLLVPQNHPTFPDQSSQDAGLHPTAKSGLSFIFFSNRLLLIEAFPSYEFSFHQFVDQIFSTLHLARCFHHQVRHMSRAIHMRHHHTTCCTAWTSGSLRILAPAKGHMEPRPLKLPLHSPTLPPRPRTGSSMTPWSTSKNLSTKKAPGPICPLSSPLTPLGLPLKANAPGDWAPARRQANHRTVVSEQSHGPPPAIVARNHRRPLLRQMTQLMFFRVWSVCWYHERCAKLIDCFWTCWCYQQHLWFCWQRHWAPFSCWMMDSH